MEMVKQLFKRIASFLQEMWYRFEDAIYANQRKTIIYALTSVVIVSLLTMTMLLANTKIRREQTSQLLFQNLPTEQIIPLSYNREAKEIQSKKAISVMFSKPQGAAYQETMGLLGQKEDELNRNFYYYPVVYNASNLAETYQLDPNDVTFIFFENGEEKNRFTFDSLENVEESFIAELNRLPMWNIRNVEPEENTDE